MSFASRKVSLVFQQIYRKRPGEGGSEGVGEAKRVGEGRV